MVVVRPDWSAVTSFAGRRFGRRWRLKSPFAAIRSTRFAQNKKATARFRKNERWLVVAPKQPLLIQFFYRPRNHHRAARNCIEEHKSHDADPDRLCSGESGKPAQTDEICPGAS